MKALKIIILVLIVAALSIFGTLFVNQKYFSKNIESPTGQNDDQGDISQNGNTQNQNIQDFKDIEFGGIISSKIPENCNVEAAAGSTYITCPALNGTTSLQTVVSSDGITANIRALENCNLDDFNNFIDNLRVITPVRRTVQVNIEKPSPLSFEFSSQILAMIKEKKWTELSAHVHPVKGVRFTPYGNINVDSDRIYTADQIKAFSRPNNEKVVWGRFDGSGEPINYSINEYFNRFIYDHDFIAAPEVKINQFIGFGNTLNNLSSVYTDGEFIEYHFDGFESKYEGMDWSSLKLVFEKYEDKMFLVGVVHDEWTI